MSDTKEDNNDKCIKFNKAVILKDIECIDYYKGEFKCLKKDCNYKWFGDKNHIKNKGGECPKCKGVAKLVKADYHKVASDNNGKWIEEEVTGSHMITGWLCENNHRFDKKIQMARTYWFCIECNPPNDYYKLVMDVINKYPGSKLLTEPDDLIGSLTKIQISCPHINWECQTRSISKNKSWKCRVCQKQYKDSSK